MDGMPNRIAYVGARGLPQEAGGGGGRGPRRPRIYGRKANWKRFYCRGGGRAAYPVYEPPGWTVVSE